MIKTALKVPKTLPLWLGVSWGRFAPSLPSLSFSLDRPPGPPKLGAFAQPYNGTASMEGRFHARAQSSTGFPRIFMTPKNKNTSKANCNIFSSAKNRNPTKMIKQKTHRCSNKGYIKWPWSGFQVTSWTFFMALRSSRSRAASVRLAAATSLTLCVSWSFAASTCDAALLMVLVHGRQNPAVGMVQTL